MKSKCPLCGKRAKRRCLLTETSEICSACCGKTRAENTCSECKYYQAPRRNYKKLPAYTPAQMSDSLFLQEISDVIESTLCQYNAVLKSTLKDRVVARIIELLFDKYHYQDVEPQETDPEALTGFSMICQAICEDEVDDISDNEMVKVLGAIYHSVMRHTRGKREYIDFILRHTGIRTPMGRLMILEEDEIG